MPLKRLLAPKTVELDPGKGFSGLLQGLLLNRPEKGRPADSEPFFVSKALRVARETDLPNIVSIVLGPSVFPAPYLETHSVEDPR